MNTGNATVAPQEATESYVITGTSGAHQDPKANLVYFQKEDGSLALTWKLETDLLDNWLLSYLDAEDAKTVYGVVNYVSEASYQV